MLVTLGYWPSSYARDLRALANRSSYARHRGYWPSSYACHPRVLAEVHEDICKMFDETNRSSSKFSRMINFGRMFETHHLLR